MVYVFDSESLLHRNERERSQVRSGDGIQRHRPAIRVEKGNEKYQYFQPLDDPETILLIDSWRDQAALDSHHASPMMAQLAALREKYDLHMRVERYKSDDD